MAKNLLIVESPAKVKTINKVLGKDFQVMTSYGHVRDLPSKDGSVDTEHDFAMAYEVIDRNEKHVDAIAKGMKGAANIDQLQDLAKGIAPMGQMGLKLFQQFVESSSAFTGGMKKKDD